MPRLEIHPKIGQCNVIIEAEMNFKSGTKHFALISSYQKPKYDKYGKFETFEFKRVWGKKPVLHHYVLWGNSSDFNQMGITQCLTDKLNACKGGVPLKRFFEIIRSSENMTFKK
jgi:hypothetical protein